MSKREMMLRAASDLFVEKGYKSLTMDDLADSLGIAKKTLYNNFPGKFELMQEALEYRLDLLLNEQEKIACDREMNFTQKLKKLIRFAAHSYSSEFPLARISSESEVIRNFVFRKISYHVVNIIRVLMKEGVEKGILRDEMGQDTPPYIFLGIIETFMNMEQRYGVKNSDFGLFVFIEKVLLEGILTDKGREEYRETGENIQ